HPPQVPSGPHEAAVRVLGSAYDRLPAHVEGGVHDHGAAGAAREGFDHGAVVRVVVSPDGLQPGAVVDVGDRRNVAARLAHDGEQIVVAGVEGRRVRGQAVLRPDRGDQQHVGAGVVQLEGVGGG